MAGQRGLAEQVRTGLVDNKSHTPKLIVISNQLTLDPLDEVYFRKPVRQHLREFGAILAIIFLIIASVKLYRRPHELEGYYYAGIAAVFIFLGYITPGLFYPVWKNWMKFATVLGLVMTTVIVGIAWLGMLVPTALLLKLFGKKTMDLTFRTSVPTYWEERDPKLNDFKHLERQY